MHLKLKARQVVSVLWVNQIFAVCEEMLSRVTKAAGSDTIQMGSAYSNLVSENITQHRSMAVVSPHIHELWRGFRFSPASPSPASWPLAKRARFSIRRMLFQTNTTSGGLFWWAQSSVFICTCSASLILRSFRACLLSTHALLRVFGALYLSSVHI